MPKIKFDSIAADITKHPRDTFEHVAKRHYVSHGTVTNVNAAGNYGNFTAHKKARLTVRDKALSVPKIERAKAAGLNPVTREQRIAGKVPLNAPQQLSLDNPDALVAVEEAFKKAQEDNYRRSLAESISDASDEAEHADNLSRWAIAIAVVSLVISVIKLLN